MKRVDLSHLAKSWPSGIVARTDLPRFTGGALSEKTAANLDSLGQGIPRRFKCGRKICYHVSDAISWLEQRSEKVTPRHPNEAGS